MSMTKAEQVAEWFHAAYERMAPRYGYRTRQLTALPWDELPDAERQLMTSAAYEVMQKMVKALKAGRGDV